MLFEELEQINENLVYLGDKPEQYKEAIIGLSQDDNHIIYSYNRFKECLMNEGMSEEDAEEWIGFNTIRSIPYMGEYASILMYDMEN